MGQKIHPGGLRVGIIHDWKSNWFSEKDFGAYLAEDLRIREHIYGKLSHAGLSDIHIRKDKQRITIDIYTARPGIVIGKSGSEVDALRKDVHAMTSKAVQININEIKRPELDAKLVAQSVAEQLQNRVSFRRAMKRSLASAIRSGAQGVKIQCGGRLGGTEMSPLRAVLGGPRPAAHAARRHRLRLLRGQDHVRPDRREGMDQQGRDHARGLRGRRRPDDPPRRGRRASGAAAARRDRGPRPEPARPAPWRRRRWRRWRRSRSRRRPGGGGGRRRRPVAAAARRRRRRRRLGGRAAAVAAGGQRRQRRRPRRRPAAAARAAPGSGGPGGPAVAAAARARAGRARSSPTSRLRPRSSAPAARPETPPASGGSES